MLTERYVGIVTFGGPAETKQNGAAYAGPRGPQLRPKGCSTNFSCSRPKGHLNLSQSGPRGPATGPKGLTTRPKGPTTGPRGPVMATKPSTQTHLNPCTKIQGTSSPCSRPRRYRAWSSAECARAHAALENHSTIKFPLN